MYYSDKPQTERLAHAELALNNAKNLPDILADLSLQGYNEAKLDEGLALLAAAQDAVRAQDREYGEQLDASDELTDEAKDARRLYMRHVKLARVVLEDDRGLQEDLGLRGRRKRSLVGWLDQARNFYTSALAKPEILAKLDTIKITEPVLTDTLDVIEEVEKQRRKAREEREDSQSATVEKDKALVKLDPWMGKFFKVARVVFEDEPQKLEALGLTIPS